MDWSTLATNDYIKLLQTVFLLDSKSSILVKEQKLRLQLQKTNVFLKIGHCHLYLQTFYRKGIIKSGLRTAKDACKNVILA